MNMTMINIMNNIDQGPLPFDVFCGMFGDVVIKFC